MKHIKIIKRVRQVEDTWPQVGAPWSIWTLCSIDQRGVALTDHASLVHVLERAVLEQRSYMSWSKNRHAAHDKCTQPKE